MAKKKKEVDEKQPAAPAPYRGRETSADDAGADSPNTPADQE